MLTEELTNHPGTFILFNNHKTARSNQAADLVQVEMDGRQIPAMEQFYSRLGHLLHFPSYFSPNLDALNDMLFDLDWLDGKKPDISISHFDAFLAAESPEKRRSLLTLLAAWSAQTGSPVYIQDSPLARAEVEAAGAMWVLE